MKDCLNAVAETLLEEMCEKIKQIPLSVTTGTRKSEILADDVKTQLDAAIKSAPCISLATDESTDVTDNAQLLVYVRYFHKDKKEVCKDLIKEDNLDLIAYHKLYFGPSTWAKFNFRTSVTFN